MSEQKNAKTSEKKLKPRGGRFLLLLLFVLFLAADIGIYLNFKDAKEGTTLGSFIKEKVNSVVNSTTNLASSLWKGSLKEENNLTSLLIVAIDARNVELVNGEFINTKPEGQAGERNADTIIQVVYDHKNGNVFMISIPRDMGIDVRQDCLEFHGSLHWVYDKGQAANCPGGGVQTMINTIQNVTGIPIQYYAFISFESFYEIINTIGETNSKGQKGLWVDVPDEMFDVYPLGEQGWENVHFYAGRQFMTTENVLKYARSRKLSSDFSRARRQQVVIDAIKNRILSTETFFNPQKLYSVIEIFKKYTLVSDLTIDEIKAGLDISRDLDKVTISHLILDPEFGGHNTFLRKIPHDRPGGPYYMVPTAWKSCPGNEFCRVQDYIHSIISYPGLYAENAKISIYAVDRTLNKEPDFSNPDYQSLKKEPIPITLVEQPLPAGSKYSKGDDITIYDYSSGQKSQTLDFLSQTLGVKSVSGTTFTDLRHSKEDIIIVIKRGNAASQQPGDALY